MLHLNMDGILCSVNKAHILRNPKTLPCNNSACSSCLNKIASYNGKFRCLFCDLEHDIKNASNDYHGEDVEVLVERNLEALCSNFFIKLNAGIGKFEEKHGIWQVSFENYIEFLDGEIELRIESLKIEIDHARDKLLKKVDLLVEQYERNSHKLNELVEDTRGESVTRINKIGRDLVDFERDFAVYSISSHLLQKCEFIGYLKGPYINIEGFKKAEPIIVDLKNQVQSLCAVCTLNEKQIAVSDYKKNEIYVFDEDFKKFERINYVQGFRIKSYYGICTSDDYENVYLCDIEYHRVLISNSKFNLIKKIILKADSVFDEFLCARDICFYGDRLFILDQGYKKVFSFSKDGDFIKTVNLNSEIDDPIDVSVGENRIAISDYKKAVFIYDYEGHLIDTVALPGVTSFCMKYGYLITHGENGSVCCYEESQERKKFIKVAELNSDRLKHRSESMTVFKDKLVISMGWAKCLAVILIS